MLQTSFTTPLAIHAILSRAALGQDSSPSFPEDPDTPSRVSGMSPADVARICGLTSVDLDEAGREIARLYACYICKLF